MLPLVMPGVQRRRNNQHMPHLRFPWPTSVPLSYTEGWPVKPAASEFYDRFFCTPTQRLLRQNAADH